MPRERMITKSMVDHALAAQLLSEAHDTDAVTLKINIRRVPKRAVIVMELSEPVRWITMTAAGANKLIRELSAWVAELETGVPRVLTGEKHLTPLDEQRGPQHGTMA